MAEPGALEIVDELGLIPHPEGGWYRETWRDPGVDGGRGTGTAILYLLAEGQVSAWHRVDATEIWHWHAGAPLALRLSAEGRETGVHRLGPAILDGESPQVIVPSGVWQSAVSLGAWTLVGCTVSPAFSFAGFELAPAGWEPGR